jgi:GT2 family glycosyltransferase
MRASGEILLFLSADAVPLAEDWLETLLGHAQRAEVGAVGARLQFGDGSVRHAGYVVGVEQGAVHAFWGFPRGHPGYWDFARVERNCSAVSGECLTIRRDLFLEEGGFDAAFGDSLADVDLCLRLRKRGLGVVWTPHATLSLQVPRERAGPGAADPTDEAAKRLREKWPEVFSVGDPFYSPYLTRTGWDFGFAPPD